MILRRLMLNNINTKNTIHKITSASYSNLINKNLKMQKFKSSLTFYPKRFIHSWRSHDDALKDLHFNKLIKKEDIDENIIRGCYLFHLEKFINNPRLMVAVDKGHLSLKKYISLTGTEQNWILWLFQSNNDIINALEKGYISIDQYLKADLPRSLETFFTKNIIELLLISGKFTVKDYLKLPENERGVFSSLFNEPRLLEAINKGFFTVDDILILNASQKNDIYHLLRYHSSIKAFETSFFTFNQFIMLKPEDRFNLTCLMNSFDDLIKDGFTLQKFNCLNEHTRNNIPGDIGDYLNKHITLDQYDKLSDIDQQWLNKSMFTTCGSYALGNKYITIEQYLSFSPEVRQDLCRIFYNAESDHGELDYCYGKIDSIFKNKIINLDGFAKLPAHNRGKILDIVCSTEPCRSALINKYITIHEYLDFPDFLQKKLIDKLSSVRGWGSHVHIEIKDIIGRIREENKKYNPNPSNLFYDEKRDQYYYYEKIDNLDLMTPIKYKK